MKLLCVDIGGTEIKYCTMEDDLKVRNYGYVPTPYTGMKDLLLVFKELALKFNDVEGIAISIPGIIDTENGIVYEGGALKYTHKQPLCKQIKEATGLDAVIENDGKAAAVAELYGGSLMGIKNGCVYIIGTGIGGGVIVDGKLVKGNRFQAGELSVINMNRESVNDGKDYAASFCATANLLKLYNRGSKNKVKNGREFFKLLPDDQKAQEALRVFARRIAMQIFNLNIVLDCDKVAIGGGISRNKSLLREVKKAAKEFTKEMGFTGLRAFPEIVNCKYCNDANLVGAYLTYRENHK